MTEERRPVTMDVLNSIMRSTYGDIADQLDRQLFESDEDREKRRAERRRLDAIGPDHGPLPTVLNRREVVVGRSGFAEEWWIEAGVTWMRHPDPPRWEGKEWWTFKMTGRGWEAEDSELTFESREALLLWLYETAGAVSMVQVPW